MFGYKVLEIETSNLVDKEGKFDVYTFLLDLKDRNYPKLLDDDEWALSKELNLYENKIIVRLL